MEWTDRIRRLVVSVVPDRSIGRAGERIAERYLRKKRLKIVARRMIESGAEIDLVAIDGKTIVFVEVKTRSTDAAGHPTESVDDAKQQQMTRAATAFLRKNDLLEYPSRFDVVAITWPQPKQGPRVEHFENAFEPTGRGQLFS